jgi:hypothetical protein
MSKFTCAQILLSAATFTAAFCVPADTAIHSHEPLNLAPNTFPQDYCTAKLSQYDTHIHTNSVLPLRADFPIYGNPGAHIANNSGIGEQGFSDIFPMTGEWKQLDIGPPITSSTAEQDEELSAPNSIDQIFAESDFQQAIQSYLWALPLVFYTQLQEEIGNKLDTHSGDLMMLSGEENTLGAQVENPAPAYILAFVDLNETGPLVIELPPEPTAVGGVGDFWQRVIIDMGQVSREQEKGGKFLVVPSGVEPPADVGKFELARSETTNVLLSLRVPNPVKGKALIKKMKIYPYAERDKPGKNKLLSTSSSIWSAAHPRGMAYWKHLHQIIQTNPVNECDRFDMAMLAALGVEKGKPFNPTDEQRKALEQGAQIGEMIATRSLLVGSPSRSSKSSTQVIRP